MEQKTAHHALRGLLLRRVVQALVRAVHQDILALAMQRHARRVHQDLFQI